MYVNHTYKINGVYGPSFLKKISVLVLHGNKFQIKKFSPYRPGVAQRGDRGIALLFHDRGTRRE